MHTLLSGHLQLPLHSCATATATVENAFIKKCRLPGLLPIKDNANGTHHIVTGL